MLATIRPKRLGLGGTRSPAVGIGAGATSISGAGGSATSWVRAAKNVEESEDAGIDCETDSDVHLKSEEHSISVSGIVDIVDKQQRDRYVENDDDDDASMHQNSSNLDLPNDDGGVEELDSLSSPLVVLPSPKLVDDHASVVGGGGIEEADDHDVAIDSNATSSPAQSPPRATT